MFVLREALRSIRRSPISAILIALVIGVGLGLVTIFGFVAYSAHKALADVERSITIDLFFDEQLGDEEARTIYEHDIASDGSLTDLAFITKEQALADYQAGTGQDVRSVLGDNPLPAGARMKLKDPSPEKLDAKLHDLRQIAGVAEALADRELESSLAQKANMLDDLTLWLGSLIGVVILIGIIVSTRLTAEIRRQSITIMRLLGASGWKVAAPFIIEGAVAGLIGGAIAIAISLSMTQLVFETLVPGTFQSLTPQEAWMVFALTLGGAVLFGILGSSLAVISRFRKV
jgi:cell division transport system permease protein